MPLHPQAAAFLQRLRDDGAAPDHRLGVEALRARADVPPRSVEAVGSVRDVSVPGPGGQLRLRVTTPAGAGAPVGVVLYLHGGGHITGTVDSYDGLTRRLANRARATVVSVDHRRAPEHRCPAAVDDAQAAFGWVTAHRSDLAPGSGGAARVVVAGDSAGGNNAAVLARRLRDRARARQHGGAGDEPVLQVLLYPTLDAVAYRQGSYPSHRQRAAGCGLTYEDGLYYWEHYLGPDGAPASPEASPLRTADLAGLAPAYVLTVEYDVLRDEGAAYADALAAAGVTVTHRHWEGHLHGFIGDPHTYDDADPALAEIATAIRQALSAP